MKSLWQSLEAQAFTPCIVAAAALTGRAANLHDSEIDSYTLGRWRG